MNEATEFAPADPTGARPTIGRPTLADLCPITNNPTDGIAWMDANWDLHYDPACKSLTGEAVETTADAGGWLCGDCIEIDMSGMNMYAGPDGRTVKTPEAAANLHRSTVKTARKTAAIAASAKQVAFIVDLMVARGIPADTDPLTLITVTDRHVSNRAGEISKREASEIIDILKAIPTAGDNTAAPVAEFDDAAVLAALADRPGRKFTPAEITDELAAWATAWAKDYTGDFAFMVDMRRAAERGQLSAGQAKGTLNCALAAIRRGELDTGGSNCTPADDGDKYTPADGDFHQVGEAVFKIQASKAGNLYAKEWDHGAWQYVGRGPFGSFSAATLMSFEQAAQFGHDTGRCVMCSIELTNPESIERGMGPICAEKWG